MVDWEALDGQAPFYATCFIMVHVLVVYSWRTLVELHHVEKTFNHAFWMQFLITTRICATFHEEPIIIGAYGYVGFMVLTAFNFFVAAFFDQLPIPSSFQHVEELVFNRKDGILVPVFSLVGQLAGAFFSYYTAVGVWWISRNHMEHHQKLLDAGDVCMWKFETTLIVPLVFQFFIGILMRMALVNSFTQRWPSLIALIYSLYYAIVPAIFGFPGFEPAFSVARVLHCFMGARHTSTNWFMWMLAYVISPHLGWCLYRYFWLEKVRPSELRKSKRAQKEQDAEELAGLKAQEEERRRVERQEAAERRRTAAETRRREPAVQAAAVQAQRGGGAKRGNKRGKK